MNGKKKGEKKNSRLETQEKRRRRAKHLTVLTKRKIR